MRLGRLPEPTGDLRRDAVAELRWGMSGPGLTVERVAVMTAVRRLPVVAAALDGVAPAAAPRIAIETIAAAARDLGDGLHARLLRNALAVGYDGPGKDLTARRVEFVQAHNAAARAAGTRNLLPETSRALYALEQHMLEALVTTLGAPPADAMGDEWPGAAADAVPAGRDDTAELTGATPAGSRAGRPRHDMPLPRQLPPATALFAGRADALAWLDAGLADADAGLAPTVLAVDGTAGVGKTALVLHWAHRVDGRFPDGQLYVDLRGHSRDGEPLAPAAALERLVRAFDVAPETLPSDERELAAVYRSLTAGKRVLVVLDNAASADQVRPLIPGAPGCVVVVTSRNALPGLVVAHGARVLTLDVLRGDEAETLLAGVIGPDRAGADESAVAALAAACAYLPLALRIVAAKLQAEPATSVGGMVARLRDTDRLTALGFGDRSDVAVRATFELSYDSLPPDERRAFRLLGLVPGIDVTPEAAAALLDVPRATAAALLDHLADGHLINRAGERYQFHDLLREYAHDRCDADEDAGERDGALGRLLAHYVRRAIEATALLHPASLRLPGDEPPATPRVAPLPDRESALGWLAAERPNLTAAVLHAAAAGRHDAAWQLAYAMRAYFLVDPSGRAWLPVGRAGLSAATEAGHLHAVSAMHGLLGRALRQAGDVPAATSHVRAALVASQEAGWSQGEVIAHCTLGGILQDEGRPAEAIAHHRAALDIDRRLSGADAGATHLANIGAALCQVGDFVDAAGWCTDALHRMRERGDERGVALSLETLGVIHHQSGRLHEAVEHVTEALAEYRRMEFRDLEAECLSTLARILCDRGEIDAAGRHAEESVRLARELDDVRIEVVAANASGVVAAACGRPGDALAWHRVALGLAERTGYLHGRLTALVGMGAAAAAAGQAAEARAHADAALAVARERGFHELEARSLAVLGAALRALGDAEGATAAFGRAAAIFGEHGCLLAAADVAVLAAFAPAAP